MRLRDPNIQVGSNSSIAQGGGLNQGRRPRIVLAIILLFMVGGIFLAIIGGRSGSLPQADQNKGATFQGMSSFIDNGLTSVQVNELIKAFNKFSANARDVSIESNSLSPGAHTPGTLAPFTIKFNVAVDSTQYTGTVSYTDTSSLSLVLFDRSNKQVFDSGLITSAQKN